MLEWVSVQQVRLGASTNLGDGESGDASAAASGEYRPQPDEKGTCENDSAL